MEFSKLNLDGNEYQVKDEKARNSINSKFISVLNYGAKGDGVTDDTAAIQNAINSNPGKVIYFPKGDYLISEPIQVTNDNTCLKGDGFKSSHIIKRGNASVNITVNYNEETFNFNNYPSVISVIFPANSNRGSIIINNLTLISETPGQNYGIVAPHISFSKILNSRIQKCIKGIVYGGYINKIENCDFLDNSSVLESTYSLATIIKGCHSNYGAYGIRNATNMSFIGCSVDNGNPCFEIVESKSVNITDCSTETNKFCIRVTNAIVNVKGGDFEGHSSETIAWNGFFIVQQGGELYIDNAYIHYEDYYGIGNPENTTLVSMNVGKAKITNSKINTPYEYTNYISGNGGTVIIDDKKECKTLYDFNKTGKFSVDVASTKTEILRLPFIYGKNYCLNVKSWGHVLHTALNINAQFSACSNGDGTIISSPVDYTYVSNNGSYSANLSLERDTTTDELVLYFNESIGFGITMYFEVEYISN